MKLAVMQPYIFPYIGYFQLIKAVDTFVFYDDVNFIKQGWINRNQILINGKANLFTIPLKKASSFNLINETLINESLFTKWKKKFLRKIEQSYSKAPFFEEYYPVVCKVMNHSAMTISEMAILSVKETSAYLNLGVNFEVSSNKFPELQNFERTERLIEMCSLLNLTTYINPIGGEELYNKKDFREKNINLLFLQPKLENYTQFENEFIKGLSIIDVLMFNSPESVRNMLSNFELL